MAPRLAAFPAVLALAAAVLALSAPPVTAAHLTFTPLQCTQRPAPGPCRQSLQRFYFDAKTQKCTSFIWGGCDGSVPFESLTDCINANCLLPACKLQPDAGPCRARYPRWYFHNRTGKCTKFFWGGCAGTVPFLTEAICQAAKCKPVDACTLAPDAGPCEAAIPKWYFNADTGKCTKFSWGGCQGTVPFDSEKECKAVGCGTDACNQTPDVGPCKARIPKWFFNHETGECTKFFWGGCRGKVPFDTVEECTKASCQWHKPEPTPVVPINTRCKLKPRRGPCAEKVQRWFWDDKDMSCKPFQHSGCLGTVPFRSKFECRLARCAQEKCLLRPEDVQPVVPPLTKTCLGFWTSWYYDQNLRRCKGFSYSGCSQLGPFKTKVECIQQKCEERLCMLTPARADRPPPPGGAECQAVVPSWAFNAGTRTCQKYVTKGCRNVGPFLSNELCLGAKCWQYRCQMRPWHIRPIPGEDKCDAWHESWYFRHRIGRCGKVRYRACEHRGPFRTEEECNTDCM